MKNDYMQAKQGAALLFVMVLLIVLSLMGASLFGFSNAVFSKNVLSYREAQKRWAAIAGLETLDALRATGKYRDALAVIQAFNLGKWTKVNEGFGLSSGGGGAGESGVSQFGSSSPYSYAFCLRAVRSPTGGVSRVAVYSHGLAFGPSGNLLGHATSSYVVGVIAVPKTGQFGMAFVKGATWPLNVTSSGIRDDEFVIGWGGDNRIMGPFHAGDGLSLSQDTQPSLVFGGEVTAHNFYDRTFKYNLDGMIEDSENNGGKALSVEDREKLLGAYGAKPHYGNDTYEKDIVEVYENMRTSPTVTVGGAINEANTPDNVVYEIKFNGSAYQYRKCTAKIIVDIVQGPRDRVSGNPLKLDTDGNGFSDGSGQGHYRTTNEIVTAIKNGTVQDLNVLVDWGFTPVAGAEGSWVTGTLSEEGDVIAVNGDALVSGTVDGHVTIAAENNIFIGKEGLLYESAPEASWQDWQINSEKKLGEIAENNETDGYEVYNYIYENIDDSVALAAKRQVIALSDPTENQDINLHASVLISGDVDVNFGQGYEVDLSDDSRKLLSETKRDQTTFYKKKKSGEIFTEQQYQGRPNKSNFTKMSAEESAYVYKERVNNKWKYTLFTEDAYEGLAEDAPEKVGATPNGGPLFEGILENPKNYIVANDSAAGEGIPDYFYKQYCTVGLHPWMIRRSSSVDDKGAWGHFNLFGTLSQYRHSRFKPGCGAKRKLMFDYRNLLGGNYAPGMYALGFEFENWTEFDLGVLKKKREVAAR